MSDESMSPLVSHVRRFSEPSASPLFSKMQVVSVASDQLGTPSVRGTIASHPSHHPMAAVTSITSQAKQQREHLRSDLKAKKNNLHRLQSQAKALSSLVHSGQKTGDSYIKLKVAGRKWSISKKEMLPIGERMPLYLELQSVKKAIRKEKGEIGEVRKCLRGRIGKAYDRGKQFAVKVWDEHSKFGTEGRGVSTPGSQSPWSPFDYYYGIRDTFWLMINGRETIRDVSKTRTIKELVTKGEKRLEEISVEERALNQATPKYSELEAKKNEVLAESNQIIKDLKAHQKKLNPDDPQYRVLEKEKTDWHEWRETELSKIDNALHEIRASNPACVELENERARIEPALKVLREQLEEIPLDHSLQMTLSSSVKAVYSYAKCVQAFSVLIPLFVKSTGPAMGVVGAAAAIATFPISLVLSVRGISSAWTNLKHSIQDRSFAQGVRKNDLNILREKVDGLGDIYSMPGLIQIPSLNAFRGEIQEASQRIIDLERGIKGINKTLLDGVSDRTRVAELKTQREASRTEIRQISLNLEQDVRRRLGDSIDEDEKAVLNAVLNRLQAKVLVSRHVDSLQTTLLPYIEQKTRTKAIQETLRLGAEGMTITSSILVTGGVVLTPVHGVGVPFMVAGTVTGLIGFGVEYPLSMLVNYLGKFAMGRNRIPTADFNAELKSRLHDEVSHWDVLQASGLEGGTSSAIMFTILKKHYKGMPPDWGPKEWASALVNDPADGKQWKRYDEALGAMRHHDDGRYLGEGVVRWVSHRIKDFL